MTKPECDYVSKSMTTTESHNEHSWVAECFSGFYFIDATVLLDPLTQLDSLCNGLFAHQLTGSQMEVTELNVMCFPQSLVRINSNNLLCCRVSACFIE